MPRSHWSEKFQKRVVNRSRYVHPKIYGTTPTTKESKSIQLTIKFWALLAASVALALIIWFLFFSPAFAIRRIDVVGSVTPDVLTEIQQLQGSNLLAYSTGSMTETLRNEQTSIRELAVYKGLPDTLRIEVGLRTPMIRWQTGDQEYFIDEQGTPFQRGEGYTATSADEQAPVVVDTANQPVVNGSPLVRTEFVQFIRAVARDFPVRFPVKIEMFELGESTLEVKLVTDRGWAVLLDTTRQADPQLVVLREIFEQFHDDINEYVDLRVEGRAYYK